MVRLRCTWRSAAFHSGSIPGLTTPTEITLMNKVHDIFFMFVLTIITLTIAVLVGTIALGVLHEVGIL
ncbi:hypothetical protein 71Y_35 [Klebsiella phage vB_KpnP_71Y]